MDPKHDERLKENSEAGKATAAADNRAGRAGDHASDSGLNYASARVMAENHQHETS